MQISDTAHHACLYQVQSLDELRAQHFFNDAEYLQFEVERFSIDQARELRRNLLLRPVSDGIVVLLFARTFTIEAQNALLKEFEEPRRGVRYLIGTPQPEQLLATLRSRLEWRRAVASTAPPTVSAAYQAFKAASYGERLELIATRTKAKDVMWCDEIYTYALRDLAASPVRHTKQTALAAEQYWQLPGTSKKMWLEEIALSL